MTTLRVDMRFYVEVHDPDSLRTFAETIQYGPEDYKHDVASALASGVMRAIGQDRIQKMLDAIPGMLVVGGSVGASVGPAWPEVENSASDL